MLVLAQPWRRVTACDWLCRFCNQDLAFAATSSVDMLRCGDTMVLMAMDQPDATSPSQIKLEQAGDLAKLIKNACTRVPAPNVALAVPTAAGSSA